MTVSYNWLKDYLKFDLQPAEVAKILTSTGLEVEHMNHVEQIPGGLAGVCCRGGGMFRPSRFGSSARYKTKYGRSGSTAGGCGAPNVAAGQGYSTTVGTTLLTKMAAALRLKVKIRGVESWNDLCRG